MWNVNSLTGWFFAKLLMNPSIACPAPKLIPDGVIPGKDAKPPRPDDTSGGFNPFSWGVYAAMTADPDDPFGLSLYDPRQYSDYDPNV